MAVKQRHSIMIIDDNTNRDNVMCGNVTGMCCNSGIMGQREIISQVREAYEAEGRGDNTTIDESTFLGSRVGHRNSNTSPLLTRLAKESTESEKK